MFNKEISKLHKEIHFLRQELQDTYSKKAQIQSENEKLVPLSCHLEKIIEEIRNLEQEIEKESKTIKKSPKEEELKQEIRVKRAKLSRISKPSLSKLSKFPEMQNGNLLSLAKSLFLNEKANRFIKKSIYIRVKRLISKHSIFLN